LKTKFVFANSHGCSKNSPNYSRQIASHFGDYRDYWTKDELDFWNELQHKREEDITDFEAEQRSLLNDKREIHIQRRVAEYLPKEELIERLEKEIPEVRESIRGEETAFPNVPALAEAPPDYGATLRTAPKKELVKIYAETIAAKERLSPEAIESFESRNSVQEALAGSNRKADVEFKTQLSPQEIEERHKKSAELKARIKELELKEQKKRLTEEEEFELSMAYDDLNANRVRPYSEHLYGHTDTRFQLEYDFENKIYRIRDNKARNLMSADDLQELGEGKSAFDKDEAEEIAGLLNKYEGE
jgi:hypothetical protein